jgi:hypothetical protein
MQAGEAEGAVTSQKFTRDLSSKYLDDHFRTPNLFIFTAKGIQNLK